MPGYVREACFFGNLFERQHSEVRGKVASSCTLVLQFHSRMLIENTGIREFEVFVVHTHGIFRFKALPQAWLGLAV